MLKAQEDAFQQQWSVCQSTLFPGLFPEGKALKMRLCAILQHLAITRTAREELSLLKCVFSFNKVSYSYHVHKCLSFIVKKGFFFCTSSILYFASTDSCKENLTPFCRVACLTEKKIWSMCFSFLSYCSDLPKSGRTQNVHQTKYYCSSAISISEGKENKQRLQTISIENARPN